MVIIRWNVIRYYMIRTIDGYGEMVECCLEAVNRKIGVEIRPFVTLPKMKFMLSQLGLNWNLLSSSSHITANNETN